MARCVLACGALFAGASAAEPWPRHVIDNSSQGADGVRLADVNGDGRVDVVTGWEEGGVVRVCYQPPAAALKRPWPSATVGRAASPEDAFAADLDGDSRPDIVSCHEGKERAVWVHWQGRDGRGWSSASIAASRTGARWMYGFAAQVDGRNGPDLIVGAKGSGGGLVAWLEAPAEPRDASAWRLHPITPAAWIMTLAPADIDGDLDTDIVVTDRRGPARGLYWLENTGPCSWRRRDIGLAGHEVMFAQPYRSKPAEGAARPRWEVWAATRSNRVFRFVQQSSGWRRQSLASPFGAKSGKAVAVAPLPPAPGGSPAMLLAHTSNSAFSRVRHKQPAVAATRVRDTRQGLRHEPWQDVSGLLGTKFDLAEWIDLDGDGDLDLVTCEEQDNLGVIWYEQP